MQLFLSKNKAFLLELAKIVGFGFLSIVLGRLQFVIPGQDAGLNDMREIALIVALFHLRNWWSLIFISLITSFGLYFGGTFFPTFIMHAIALTLLFFVYKSINVKINNRVILIIIWIVIGLVYFYVLLIPLMVVLSHILGIINISEYLTRYVELAKESRIESLMTTSITGLYLLYLKTTEILEIQNKNLYNSMQKVEESEHLKSAFLQNLSHEIRTPLNGILGFSKLLQQLKCENSESAAYTKNIIASGHQLLNIVNDVVDASQLETQQTRVLITKQSLSKVFEEVIHSLESKGDEQIARIQLNLNDCEAKKIDIDAYKLERINYHLIENALKFSKFEVCVNFEISNDILKIAIEDKGIGIDPCKKDEVFMKFRQVDVDLTRDYGGNGLGLTIVKGFVEVLKGKVWFSSIPGKGTSFFVEIPVGNQS